MMARVSGSWMMNFVPTPGTVSTSTRPFRRSMDFSTTSRPDAAARELAHRLRGGEALARR